MSDEDDYAPMVIASFRLPASLIGELDRLADLDHKRRADIVREALTGYVADRTAPVARSEAERALAVLDRLVRRADLPAGTPGRTDLPAATETAVRGVDLPTADPAR